MSRRFKGGTLFYSCPIGFFLLLLSDLEEAGTGSALPWELKSGAAGKKWNLKQGVKERTFRFILQTVIP